MHRIAAGLLLLGPAVVWAAPIYSECTQDSDCTFLCSEKLATLTGPGDGGVRADRGAAVDAGILGIDCKRLCQCAFQIDGVCSATPATERSSAPTVTGGCDAASLFAAQGPDNDPVYAKRYGCSTTAPQLSVLAGAMMAFALWQKRKKRW